MRVERLSTYGTDQLLVSHRLAQAAHSGQEQTEISELEAVAALERARQARPLWRRLLNRASEDQREAERRLAEVQRQLEEVRALRARAAIRVVQRSRGEEGEYRFEAAMAHLSDDWIMFRSYLTKRGEADAVLVGPDGLWVVEVKNRRVRLTVDGDRWEIERLSTRGRPQGREPARDRGGRSWGSQAADAARALSSWLDHNGQPVAVRTAVVLVDPGASVVWCRDPGVDLVTERTAQLEHYMRLGSAGLSPSTRASIEALIRRDHEHTVKRRESSRRTG